MYSLRLVNTRKRRNARRVFEQLYGRQELIDRMYQIISKGKQGVDAFVLEVGKMIAEAIMYIEREEISGPEYRPLSSEIQKWASQGGSIYLGDQKVGVDHPRLRGPQGEIALKSYQGLKEPGRFSEELLCKLLRGISAQRYQETVIEAAGAFGVSASSVSRHIVAVTTRKLKEFRERSLSECRVFAVFIDTVHRAGCAFMVALGIDTEGRKQVLGFWEGATENQEMCQELLADLER